MNSLPPPLTDTEIQSLRTPKNQVDPFRPYAYLVEPERGPDGDIVDVATIFLTNKECPFRCLMCDLWKNTLDTRVPEGAIATQIDFALSELAPASHVKLYNSGNFFDRQAIPFTDFPAIAERLARFKRVIVETHPHLCGQDCCRFRDLIDGELEVALGLETIHSEALDRLNKRMTLADFDRAVERLRSESIHVRAFLLLRPPYLSEAEGLEWAIKSLEHAFEVGVECCSVIPTRAGNGAMDRLLAAGQFEPPTLGSLEAVQEAGIGMNRGRVFVDLWDCERLAACPSCGPARRRRMHRMNLTQRLLPAVRCGCT